MKKIAVLVSVSLISLGAFCQQSNNQTQGKFKPNANAVHPHPVKPVSDKSSNSSNTGKSQSTTNTQPAAKSK